MEDNTIAVGSLLNQSLKVNGQEKLVTLKPSLLANHLILKEENLIPTQKYANGNSMEEIIKLG